MILVLFSMLSFANGLQWVTFSSIASDFGTHYNLSEFQVDLFSMIYMIVYPIANFPSSYLVDRVDMRLAVF